MLTWKDLSDDLEPTGDRLHLVILPARRHRPYDRLLLLECLVDESVVHSLSVPLIQVFEQICLLWLPRLGMLLRSEFQPLLESTHFQSCMGAIFLLLLVLLDLELDLVVKIVQLILYALLLNW